MLRGTKRCRGTAAIASSTSGSPAPIRRRRASRSCAKIVATSRMAVHTEETAPVTPRLHHPRSGERGLRQRIPLEHDEVGGEPRCQAPRSRLRVTEPSGMIRIHRQRLRRRKAFSRFVMGHARLHPLQRRETADGTIVTAGNDDARAEERSQRIHRAPARAPETPLVHASIAAPCGVELRLHRKMDVHARAALDLFSREELGVLDEMARAPRRLAAEYLL